MYEHPGREQHGEAIQVGGTAEHVEIECAEDRVYRDALQAVIASGEEARIVGCGRQQRGHRQRQHEQGEAGGAQDDGAGYQADDGGGASGNEQSGNRFLADMDGINAGGVGADAEERGVAQRDDTRVAQHEIER